MENKTKTLTKKISKITKVDENNKEKLVTIIKEFYLKLNKLNGPLDLDFSQYKEVLDKIQCLTHISYEKSNAQDNTNSNNANKSEQNEDIILVYLRAFLVLKQKITNIGPLLKPYEQSILFEISKLKNVNRKAKYYYIFTNYFTNFDGVDFDELILIDNYYYNEYLTSADKDQVKLKNEKIGLFKNYCSFYTEKFIESDNKINNFEFLKLEIIVEHTLLQIINLVKFVDNQNGKKNYDLSEFVVCNLFGKINSIFVIYIQTIKNKINNKLVQKVIYVLFYFFSFSNQDTHLSDLSFKECVVFLQMILEVKWKKYFSYITDLFLIFLKNIKSPSNFHYLSESDTFKGNLFSLYTWEKLIEKQILFPNDYVQTINSIFKPNPNYNVYKGCLLFISELFLDEKKKNFESHEMFRIFFLKIIKEIIKSMDEKVKDEVNIYSEIMQCIDCMTKSYEKEITLREWKMIIKIINSMTAFDLVAIKKNKANGQIIFRLINRFYNSHNKSWLKSDKFNTMIEEFISIKDQYFDELNMDLINFKLYFTFNSTFLVFRDLLGPCIMKYIGQRGSKEKERQLSIEAFIDKSFDIFNGMYEIIMDPNIYSLEDKDNKNIEGEPSIVIENRIVEFYPQIVNSIFEVIKKEEEKKKEKNETLLRLTELLNNFKKLIITLIIESENEKFYVELSKHFMHLVKGDEEANKLTESMKNYKKFVLDMINDLLIQLNSVNYTQKMAKILGVFLSKENGKFKYQRNAYECISLFQFTKSGKIIITKKEEKNNQNQKKNNQDYPCLEIYREGIKLDKDNYYYIDLGTIISEYLTNLKEKKCQRFILLCFKQFHFLSPKTISSTINTILQEEINISFSSNIVTILALYNNINIPKENQDFQDTKKNEENNKTIIFPNEPLKNKILNYFLNLIPGFNSILTASTKSSIQPINPNTISTLKNLQQLIGLLVFYLNSTDNYKIIDKNIPKEEKFEEIIQNIINKTITLIINNEQIDSKSGLFLIITLFLLKEQIAKCNSNIIIVCIYICLLLGHPEYYSSIHSNFDKYHLLKKGDVYLELYERKPCHIFELGKDKIFAAFLCDIICLYLISYVKPSYVIFKKKYENDIQKSNESTRCNNLLNLFSSIINSLNNNNKTSKRLSFFKDLCFSILCLEQNFRSNITQKMKEEIKSSIYNMKIYLGENDVQILNVKNDITDVYLINSVSQVKFSYFYENPLFTKQPRRKQNKLLKSILSDPMNWNSNDDEDNNNEDEQIELDIQSIHPLLLYEKHPPEIKKNQKDNNHTISKNDNEIEKKEITKAKRILHSPNEEITKDKKDKVDLILSLLDTPTSFDIHVTVSFSGSSSSSKERFINFLSLIGKLYENTNDNYTLIYKDLFYNVIFDLIDTMKSKEEKEEIIKRNNIHIIWDSSISVFEEEYLSQDKKNMIILIKPLSDKLYLVKKRGNININDDMLSFVDTMFMKTYLINSTSNSGVRYLMNNIILISEWFKYHSSSYEKENITYVEYSNDLTQRQDILNKLGIKDKIEDI